MNFTLFYLSVGHVYISGWKHDQIDKYVPYAKLASAKIT